MEGVSPPAHCGDPGLTRLRQAVDASGEIMVMTDRDGAFTFVNPAADDELRVQLASEREQAYARLLQERDRAQRSLDAADVILLALDLDGRITAINRKGCSILGWDERELLRARLG